MFSRDIGEFLRAYNEKVCLEVDLANGQIKYHLRVYRNECDWNQNWQPTGEGITISPDYLPQLKRLIIRAIKYEAVRLSRK